ncbi:MAG: DNA repair protein RecN [Bdellovibrionota bacterium]
MLLELKVHNFAIIENISLDFNSGLNIMSGETGAGKSVLLKSLTLLMGEKADTDSVRSGCESATVEGSFDISSRFDIQDHLKNLGIDFEEDLLVVRRMISAQGKSRVYINGSLSTLNTLQNIVAPLIELTGHKTPLIELTSQHENKNLMAKTYHLDLLDHYVGAIELRVNFNKGFQKLSSLDAQISEIEEKSKTQAQRIDFLKYQKEEIEALNLKPGQDADLEGEYFRIKNSSKISSFLEDSESTLFGDDDSVLVRIHKIIQRSTEFSTIDPEFKKIFEPLTSAKSILEDLVYELRSYGKELNAEPGSLDQIETKMNQLRQLQKKYGNSLDEILEAHTEISDELNIIENSDALIAELKKEKTAMHKALTSQAKELHKRRLSGAELLSKNVNDELKDLNMKGVSLIIQVTDTELNSNGASDVEFMIQNSSKEPARSLAKFASGGELSRILLSLKKVVGFNELPRTYLFDEVDTGVSGVTAEKVGKKLKSISKGQQVICVTHLAQVAAYGDTHFLIEKNISKKNGTQMQVLALKKDEREKEIARLISGEKITKTSLDHARELLRNI